MDIVTYKCDECKSVNQTEVYRQNPKNFDTIRVEIGGNNVPLPIPMPMQFATFKVCKECQAKETNFKKSLEALIAPLKQNQTDMAAEQSAIINS